MIPGFHCVSQKGIGNIFGKTSIPQKLSLTSAEEDLHVLSGLMESILNIYYDDRVLEEKPL